MTKDRKIPVWGIVKKFIVIGLALLLAGAITGHSVFGASAVTVTGGDNVAGGETFTVKITYDGDNIGRVSGSVTYDTSMLTYISGGSSTGNVGYVSLENAGTGEALSFELKFQAVKDGTTDIKVTTKEMYDLDEMYMDNPSATKTVTITGDAAEDELIIETPEDQEGGEEPVGLDEKESEVDSTRVLLFGAIAAAILILIIAIIMRRKK